VLEKFGVELIGANRRAIEMAEDNDLSSSRYAEPRRLNVDAMQQYVNAILRSTEVDNNNTKVILKEMKEALQSIVHTAKEIEEAEEALNENYGFSIKTEGLKKQLADLRVVSSFV
jgi:carbamoylphosphate synthase large subunit